MTAFLGLEISTLAKKHADITERTQHELKLVMNKCSKDFDFPLEKPYNTEHENYNHFALCLRNNVAINPTLNESKGIRENILGFGY